MFPKEIIDMLRATGDFCALSGIKDEPDFIKFLNPYYTKDADDPAPRVTESIIVRAVQHLLALAEAATGERLAEELRKQLKFRTDYHEVSRTYVLLELEQGSWLLCADLVVIRALEYNVKDGRLMTTAEVESAFGLAPGTAKKAAQRGSIPAEKPGHDYFIRENEAVKKWGQVK